LITTLAGGTSHKSLGRVRCVCRQEEPDGFMSQMKRDSPPLKRGGGGHKKENKGRDGKGLLTLASDIREENHSKLPA